ncbi:MAG: hypothetical protein V4507_00155 [Verrucomicrobiota bacterium]
MIELVIAIGIASFVLVTLLGLVAVGLKIFRESEDVSIRTQILQQVISLANQSHYSEIIDGSAIPEVLYFDQFGSTNATAQNYVYEVHHKVDANPHLLDVNFDQTLAMVRLELVTRSMSSGYKTNYLSFIIANNGK